MSLTGHPTRWIIHEDSQKLPWDGDWEFPREGKVPTCSPLYQGHVVEVSVFSQAGLYHILSVGQFLRGGGGMMAPVPCGSRKGLTSSVTSLMLSTYSIILIGNGSPLHQARDDFGGEELLALTGHGHNTVL